MPHSQGYKLIFIQYQTLACSLIYSRTGRFRFLRGRVSEEIRTGLVYVCNVVFVSVSSVKHWLFFLTYSIREMSGFGLYTLQVSNYTVSPILSPVFVKLSHMFLFFMTFSCRWAQYNKQRGSSCCCEVTILFSSVLPSLYWSMIKALSQLRLVGMFSFVKTLVRLVLDEKSEGSPKLLQFILRGKWI